MNNYLNTNEFQKLLIDNNLSYSKANIYWWIRTLQLPARKVLRDYLININDAYNFVEKLKERKSNKRGRKPNADNQEA